MDDSKLVVCKGYYGLGGNIAILLCAKRISDLLGRRLLVDWRENRNYGLSESDIFTRLFSSNQLESLDFSLYGKKIWPSFWSEFIDRTQPYSSDYPLSTVRSSDLDEYDPSEIEEYDVIVITRDDNYWHSHEYLDEFSEISKCLVPKPEILDQIDEFEATKFSSKKTIGIHFRHGNGERTVVPPDINWFYQKIDPIFNKHDDSTIFVCTDCSAVVEEFANRYPGSVVHTEKEYLPLGSGGMHYAQNDDGKLRSAKEALVDIWLLSRCSTILGSKSFFSRLAIILGNQRNLENHFVWNPIYRSHRPLEGHVTLSQDELLTNLFDFNSVPKDGLFIHKDGDLTEIFYLYEKICSFSKLDEIDPESVFQKIKDFRIY